MHINARLKFILFPLLLCISFFAHADINYSKVYIFGDSLSDTGNLAAIYGDFPSPYYQNRITNGPVAVDTLTAKLGYIALASLKGGDNYSVAGAKASGIEQQDLSSQIFAFHERNNYIAPSDALYVIFFGGNDIRSATYQPNNAIASSIIRTANNKIKKAIKKLYRNGARSFLVINAPNIGLIPETKLNAAAYGNPTLLTRAERFTRHFNLMLHNVVEKLEKKKGIHISELNLFKLFDKIVKNAAEFQFSNSTDACFSSVTYTFHPDCHYGLNFDQFIFFDEIHPTTRVHTIFGKAFIKALSDDEEEHEDMITK